MTDFCPVCFGVESHYCDVCLNEKIARLNAQIEKMKNCDNCKHGEMLKECEMSCEFFSAWEINND